MKHQLLYLGEEGRGRRGQYFLFDEAVSRRRYTCSALCLRFLHLNSCAARALCPSLPPHCIRRLSDEAAQYLNLKGPILSPRCRYAWNRSPTALCGSSTVWINQVVNLRLVCPEPGLLETDTPTPNHEP